jgi:hypothetical protein
MKRKNRKSANSMTHGSVPGTDVPALTGSDGINVLSSGSPPNADQLDTMTKTYQESIRNSPLWALMVEKYGTHKAKEILKQCKVELR